jgi:hypothetical protein
LRNAGGRPGAAGRWAVGAMGPLSEGWGNGYCAKSVGFCCYFRGFDFGLFFLGLSPDPDFVSVY